MSRQEIIAFCASFPAVYEDYPFDEIAGAGEGKTTVMRHRANKKSFALIMDHGGRLYLNLKCDPLEADILRQAFAGVIPGWHMNKEHWNSLIMGSDVPRAEIERQIGNSYNLTKPKRKKG
jgi:predicted DNA-binding protein (MmcQ/YjbR family)